MSYDLCNIKYYVTMYIDFYFNTNIEFTYFEKYFTLVCFYKVHNFNININSNILKMFDFDSCYIDYSNNVIIN